MTEVSALDADTVKQLCACKAQPSTAMVPQDFSRVSQASGRICLVRIFITMKVLWGCFRHTCVLYILSAIVVVIMAETQFDTHIMSELSHRNMKFLLPLR